jgi:undecaprenyl-diphosphatase
MDAFEIIILAIVQGLTEFLPVSSSGHLVVSSAVLEALGFQAPADVLQVNIVLHLGTLASVLVYFRRRVWRLVGEDRRVALLLVVGTLPAVAVTVALKMFMPEMEILESPLLSGLMFPLTAAMLIWASRIEPGDVDYTRLGYRDALVIGLLQAIAILPGVSRSGATIVAGLALGLRRESAVTFAFLLAIPAIAGAGVLEMAKLLEPASAAESTPAGLLLIGAAVSFVVGLAALDWLLRLVERGRLAWFAYYLIPLGVAVTLWQLFWVG